MCPFAKRLIDFSLSLKTAWRQWDKNQLISGLVLRPLLRFIPWGGGKIRAKISANPLTHGLSKKKSFPAVLARSKYRTSA